MVTVSFVLALVAFASFQIFFISLPCASVSIILALISRGDGPLVYTDPDAENGSTDASSKSGEALLREILSGQYRADKQSGISSDTAPSGTDSQSANEVSATLNGGRVI